MRWNMLGLSTEEICNRVLSILPSLPVVVKDFKAVDIQYTNNSVFPMNRGVIVLDLNDVIDASYNPTKKTFVYCLWEKGHHKFLSVWEWVPLMDSGCLRSPLLTLQHTHYHLSGTMRKVYPLLQKQLHDVCWTEASNQDFYRGYWLLFVF